MRQERGQATQNGYADQYGSQYENQNIMPDENPYNDTHTYQNEYQETDPMKNSNEQRCTPEWVDKMVGNGFNAAFIEGICN